MKLTKKKKIFKGHESTMTKPNLVLKSKSWSSWKPKIKTQNVQDVGWHETLLW
jgi:hypothetical protein